MKSEWGFLAIPRHEDLTNKRDFIFRNIFQPTVTEFLKTKAGSTILDVGCHTGYLTGIMAEFASHIVGIDPSKEAIEVAEDHCRNMANVEFAVTNVENYSLRNNKRFDFAIANMTAQTVRKIGPFFTAINRVLAPGGELLFSIPHPCFWALLREEIIKDSYSYIRPSKHRTNFRLFGKKPMQVTYYHRPLSFYARELSQSSFSITNILEPFPSSKIMSTYDREWPYPGIIFLTCRKEA